MTRETLIEDAQRMEDACCRLAQPTDIWQDRIIYWMCVAVYHLLQIELRRLSNGNERDR